MSAPPFGLRSVPGDPDLVDALVAQGAERTGLPGLLASRGRLAWPAWVRGRAAFGGFRWSLRDTYDATWWPQGIDVGEHEGRRLLAVSWYAQPVRGIQRGARVTFVDLGHRLPRYHHVLLMEPVRERGTVRLAPVLLHAGGIAWSGGTLIVADTAGGARLFSLGDLLRVSPAPFGFAHVLPQSARWVAEYPEATEARRMRFSFLSLERGDVPHLVAGEYGNTTPGSRLVRIELGPDGALATDDAGLGVPVETHEPGLLRMQGACVVDGTWFVVTSNGERRLGDLWSGAPGRMRRHRHVLPPGPEDLAFDPGTGRIWSLSEWPGRRRVFQIDPSRWR